MMPTIWRSVQNAEHADCRPQIVQTDFFLLLHLISQDPQFGTHVVELREIIERNRKNGGYKPILVLTAFVATQVIFEKILGRKDVGPCQKETKRNPYRKRDYSSLTN